jgi:hypothetical protein
MHLDEEQLQRLMHGELARGPLRAARDHIAECGECRERLITSQRDEGEIFGLLRHLDHPIPAVDADAVAARAGRFGRTWIRWAAGILLFVGAAGVAYATPGSPLRDWVRSVAAWIAGTQQSPAVPTQSEAPSPRFAGVAADPGDQFAIVFESPDPGGLAQVSLIDGREVTVRAPAGTASFTSSANRLLIATPGQGTTVQIGIPRAAPRVEIRVARRRVFLKDGSRIETESRPDGRGQYLLPLSRSGP